VAPPGNQAANGENKPQPVASEETGLLDSINLSINQGDRLIALQPKASPREYLAITIGAIVWVMLVDYFTNTLPPHWDGCDYIFIATEGIIGNKHLIAPFAYVPGIPFVARGLADLAHIPIASAFEILIRLGAVSLIVLAFALAHRFTHSFWHAAVPAAAIACTAPHVKYPLFLTAFIDGATYPIMLAAMLALVSNRVALCMIIAGVGILFKEFLAVPLALLMLSVFLQYLKTREPKDAALLVGIGALTAFMAIAPRALIPVEKSFQDIEPFKCPPDLRGLLQNPRNMHRNLNIAHAFVSYWLPTLMLITPGRLKNIWHDLAPWRLMLIAYLGLIAFLTMYGGQNLYFFVGYALAAQIIILATMTNCKMHRYEFVCLFVALIVYNKIFLRIPLPEEGFYRFVDFYGCWSSRVSIQTLARFAEALLYILLAVLVRRFAAQASRPQQS